MGLAEQWGDGLGPGRKAMICPSCVNSYGMAALPKLAQLFNTTAEIFELTSPYFEKATL